MTEPSANLATRLNLDQCAVEPIHIPGAIQPHGALLVLSEPELLVVQSSANLTQFLAMPSDRTLGRPLASLLSEEAVATIREAVATIPSDGQNFDFFTLPDRTGAGRLMASVHRHDGVVLLELESAPTLTEVQAKLDLSRIGSNFSAQVLGVGNLYEVARSTAEVVTEITHYDRVMVYRLLPDGSGEVIAEIRRPAASPFLGNRFPATDIPAQARRLYEINLLRVIENIEAIPAPLIPTINPVTGRPLDLSRATLRAVSPVHIQYLKNMGVAATLTASLMVEGRLWGLIACHHNGPRALSAPVRSAVALVAAIAAEAIQGKEEADQLEAERQLARRLTVIERSVARADNVVRMLLAGDPGLLDLASSDGLALIVDQAVVTFGLTPDATRLPLLVDYAARRPELFLATDDLASIDGAFIEDRASAAGALVTVLSISPIVALAAFRQELIHEISWGGDPNKSLDETAEVLTPRNSFDLWRQQVTGHCRAWEPEAITAWRGIPVWLASAFGGYSELIERLAIDLVTFATPSMVDEPFLRALLNTMAGTLLVIREGGPEAPSRVMATNRTFRQLFHRAPEELIGLPVVEALTSVGLPVGDLTNLPPAGLMESVVMTQDFGQRIFSISYRPLLRLRAGATDRAFAAWVLEDVTKPRRIEQALAAARDQALTASRAKTNFLASMSHELRTPLNAIIGFSEIMRAELFGSLGSPKYRDYVRHIQTSGEHLLSVIGDILDISKVEAGRYVLEEQSVELGELVADICLMEQDQAERAGVKLMQESAGNAVCIQADARALRQILLNLLSNSFKFTPAGGMVTCRTQITDAGSITLEVQDTGIGIPQEYLQRVLDPFFQINIRKSPGAGLGLSIVRSLAQLHEAHLEINSQTGRGTCFRISFPAWRTLSETDYLASAIGTALRRR